MAKVIDYYLSLMSPWSYLGAARFADILRRAGATAVCKPVDFGRIFPASGGLALGKRAPQRQAYRMMELRRWRDRLGIDLNLEPRYFPTAESLAAGVVIAARDSGAEVLELSAAILRAVWAEERDIAEPETLRALAGKLGLDGDRLLDAAASDEVRRAYEAGTEEAIARGVFGAPTYILEDEIFWGQDRLDFLARGLGLEWA
ncbi:MAG: 2-hydroxychromene-2-carboxylate isomerase [Alphaproteobacteria bacterium]|nr:2-hydroxychromene-2-carboxylate isomerase [Alphaproteobacteria bacterium]